MTDPRFTIVPFQGTFDAITTRVCDVETATVASTTASMTPLDIYLRIGTHRALEIVLSSPPSVGAVVNAAMAMPGITVHDRAVDLLGRMAGQTLSLAIQAFSSTDYLMRPVYADKAWEMLTAALSQTDDAYQPHVIQFLEKLRADPNPAKRLAAIDALDTLEA
jgi:hypothetical protein